MISSALKRTFSSGPMRSGATAVLILIAAIPGCGTPSRIDRAVEEDRISLVNFSTVPVRAWIQVREHSFDASPSTDKQIIVDGPWLVNPGHGISHRLGIYPEYAELARVSEGNPRTYQCWWIELPPSTGEIAGIYGLGAWKQRGDWLDNTFSTHLTGDEDMLQLWGGGLMGAFTVGGPDVDLPKSPRFASEISPMLAPESATIRP
jgi:hypothetical protein